jgi:membrane peptidoglycan carboxypeptidase
MPDWKIMETDEPSAPARQLPFRASTLAVARDVLAGVVDQGTGSAARAYIPEAARGFAKTGTAGENEELLMVGSAGGVVVTMWVGHQDGRRSVSRHAEAGRILAPYWGRIVARALEATRRYPGALAGSGR